MLLCCCPDAGFRAVYNLDLVELDVSRDLEEQGPFDALILKWNQQLAKALAPQPDSKVLASIGRVQTYLAAHPQCAVVDPIASQMMVMKRDEVVVVFQELSKRVKARSSQFSISFLATSHQSQGLKCPFSFIIQEGESNLPAEIKFPVICKTIEAGGTSEYAKLLQTLPLSFSNNLGPTTWELCSMRPG